MAKAKSPKDNGALDLKVDLANFKNEVNERFDVLDQKINHLPTKDEFFGKMDKVVGELQKLRDEVVITGHHYEKTNKRVNLIDKHLGINTSVVFYK